MVTDIITGITRWTIPILVLIISLLGVIRKVKVYETFVDGATEGLKTTVRIAPYLVTMFVAIRVFRVSGAMDLLIQSAQPLTGLLHIPDAILPMALIRPLSGSGALGMLAEIFKTHGPDSLAGLTASTMQGSTETTFYIITVYFGAIGVNRVRHALTIGLWADFVGLLAAVWVCRWLFT